MKGAVHLSKLVDSSDLMRDLPIALLGSARVRIGDRIRPVACAYLWNIDPELKSCLSQVAEAKTLSHLTRLLRIGVMLYGLIFAAAFLLFTTSVVFDAPLKSMLNHLRNSTVIGPLLFAFSLTWIAVLWLIHRDFSRTLRNLIEKYNSVRCHQPDSSTVKKDGE